ncbi:MAG: DUF916 domain-containing protein [Streptococcaceae bacterium]|nr:DUF916 domain-containing protein [Streptococcaceae bacterium]
MFQKSKMKAIIYLTTILAFFLISAKLTQADEVGFSAIAVLEKHQTDNSLSYWRLKPEAGKDIHLVLKITNGEKKNTFTISANQAITNQNLVVDYGLDKKSALKLLSTKPAFDFYSQVLLGDKKTPKEVTIELKPNESIEFPLIVKVPDNLWDGVQIGGINVTRKPSADEQKASIVNLYNYAFALVLEGNEVKSGNELSISMDKLTVDKQAFTLKNETQNIVKNVDLHGAIKDKDGKKVAQVDINNGTIVPFAQVSIPLISKEPLRNGHEYTFELTKKNGDEKTTQEFKITVDNVGKITSVEAKNTTLLYVLGAIIGIGMFIFILLVNRNKKRTKGRHE